LNAQHSLRKQCIVLNSWTIVVVGCAAPLLVLQALERTARCEFTMLRRQPQQRHGSRAGMERSEEGGQRGRQSLAIGQTHERHGLADATPSLLPLEGWGDCFLALLISYIVWLALILLVDYLPK
jgi:hypothetical protein